MKKVLLTGYSGVVGSFLLHDLLEKKYNVLCLGRRVVSGCEHYQANIDSNSDYISALSGMDVVIHCAGRSHVMSEKSLNSLSEYRETNTFGTINLAKQAMLAGVKRFIFISSIKVNGESTELNKPFLANDARNPIDPYAQSKSEAEEELLKLSENSGMDVVIIRPPLVYGPNVKSNFASLLKLVSKNIPLPFGCINQNRRSLVSVRNLTDLILTCIDHPKASNEVFLVSDDCDLSTAQIIKEMGRALNKHTFMLPVPVWCYYAAGRIFSKQEVVSRLLGSLQVDIEYTKKTLNWEPSQSIADGFKATTQQFLEKEKGENTLIRVIDFFAASLGIVCLWPIMLLVIVIGYFDTGSPIFIQTRVGKDKKPFKLIKFRTMSLDTKSIASHLASSSSITGLGKFLRKTKIDELPQLINVVKGEMSLVGPRPNLFNQDELIKERDALGVYDVLPGITGLAQVQNIDMSTPQLLAKTDMQMIDTLTVKDYFKYIIMTITGSGSGDVVK